jgi:hypothetical protein
MHNISWKIYRILSTNQKMNENEKKYEGIKGFENRRCFEEKIINF